MVEQWKMGGLREKKGGRCCLLEMGSQTHLGFTFLLLDVYCNTEVHIVALFEVLFQALMGTTAAKPHYPLFF